MAGTWFTTLADGMYAEIDGVRSPCHIFTDYRALPNGGHRQIKVDQKWVLAHRVAFTLHHGREPDGQLLRHLCNHPACINPKHLKGGTDRENAADRIAARKVRAVEGAAADELRCVVVEDGSLHDPERLVAAWELSVCLNAGFDAEALASAFDFNIFGQPELTTEVIFKTVEECPPPGPAEWAEGAAP
jgi:hypothetical protein